MASIAVWHLFDRLDDEPGGLSSCPAVPGEDGGAVLLDMSVRVREATSPATVSGSCRKAQPPAGVPSEPSGSDTIPSRVMNSVPSGTMGNLLGLLVSARSGQEIIAEADSHLFMNEAAGAAVVGGIQVRQVRTERGVLSPAQVLAALRPGDDDHQPTSAAVMIENTHNWHGGLAWSLPELQLLYETARTHDLEVDHGGHPGRAARWPP
jgi:threonine aldolase